MPVLTNIKTNSQFQKQYIYDFLLFEKNKKDIVYLTDPEGYIENNL